MRYLSLFSGIEAASVAWERLGWKCAAVAEIEPFPCKVLAHRYPDVPNLGDITQITQERIEALGHIDLVVFGAPCQDLSVAGKRKGMLNEDGSPTRSGLFYAAERIATWAEARWAIYENVPGMFSSNAGADFASVVGEMAGAEFDVPKNKWRNAGVAVGPRGLVEWVTLDAQYVRTPEFARAVPQRRRRVFVVRDSGDWSSRPPLFLEPESMCGNPPPSRTPGKTVAHDVAGSLVSSGRGVERAGDTRGQDPVIAVGGEVSHTLSSEGFDASEDGTGRGTPIVARCLTTGEGARLDGESCNFIATGVTIHGTDKTQRILSYTDVCGSLRTKPPGTQENSSTTALLVPAFGIRTANTSSNGCGVSDGLAYTLDQAQGQAVCLPINTQIATRHEALGRGTGFGIAEDGEPAYTLQAGHSHAVAFAQNTRDEVRMIGGDGSIAGALAAQPGMKQQSYVAIGWSEELTASENVGRHDGVMTPAMQVRRLTPLECERLQGFPEQWTNIPGASDSARYKALGNSMAGNVMHFIGQRINDSH